MFCGCCGAKINDDHIFCPYCGKKIEIKDKESALETEGKEILQEITESVAKNEQQSSETDSNVEPRIDRNKIIAAVIVFAVMLTIVICFFNSANKKGSSQEKMKSQESQEESFEKFGFENMMGMNVWVKINDYDFENGTISINCPDELKYLAEFIPVMMIEEKYMYEKRMDCEGVIADEIRNTAEIEILDNKTLSVYRDDPFIIEPKYSDDKKLFVIETSENTCWVSIDLIDWQNYEMNNATLLLTYKFK